MTTIAFDGKTIAADRRGTRQGLSTVNTKMWKLENGEIVAVCGSLNFGMTVKRWYQEGASPDKYPAFQADDEKNCWLIVVKNGELWVYGVAPDPVKSEDPFAAYGSGRDFAIAAMALGKSAVEAVELAGRFDTSTGNGIDSFEVINGP